MRQAVVRTLLVVVLGVLCGLPTLQAESPETAQPGAASALPQGLGVQRDSDQVTYTSPWLKVSFLLHHPTMTYLSVDAVGSGRHGRNLLKEPVGAGPTASSSVTASVAGNVVRYADIGLLDRETDALTYTVEPKRIGLVIDRDIAREYDVADATPLRLLFDATVTPVSPLGRIDGGNLGVLQFPVLLHFPDWGSLLVRAKVQGGDAPTWQFSLCRDLKPLDLGAVAGWRPMTPDDRKKIEQIGNRNLLQRNVVHVGPEQIQLDLRNGGDTGKQRVGKQRIELDMTVTAIYPEAGLVDADPKLVGIKRAWLNMFGFRVDLACLANNSTGDTCQFCLYCYADHGCHTPPLFDEFTALDLVRISLDRYFDGFKGYADDFQDVAPSTIIAAWDYAVYRPDGQWLKRRIDAIERCADRMIAMDIDDDGLCESERGPTNWWDCIDWNWKDGYSSALAWRAFRCIADLEHRVGNETKASFYRDRAEMIKAIYCQTFFNPETGVLAGWRSRDGKLGDCCFLWVNGIAISYGLVDARQADAILDRLQAKIKEVGFSSFRLGLPGNLVPFPADFPSNASLGFQLYENGGATGSMAYHYLQALYATGRKVEAEAIFDKMLDGYREGTFQNGVGNGGDWKEWDGTPCGYEGLLVDAYYPLMALITGRLGRGVAIP